MTKFRLSVQQLAVLAALTLSVTACVNIPYRAPVQQGNVIEADRAQAIVPGMSKEQVVDVVGSPVMYNLFHQDRWDYIYRLDQRNKPIQQKRVTIWFSNGSVAKVEHTDLANK